MSNSQANEVINIRVGDIPEIIKSHSDRLDWSLRVRGHRRGLTAPLFVAEPGMGKTELGYATAAMLDRQHFDVRMGDIIPSDVRLPRVDVENRVAEYFGNTEFPFLRADGSVSGDSRILGVMDEYLDASLPMFRLSKQILNENRVGNLHFPHNTLWVALANGIHHGCMSERLPLSNANRLAFYVIVPDLEQVQKYWSELGYYPVLEAFLRCNTDVPYDIDIRKWDGTSNFPSFRTLEELGMLIESDWMEDREDETGETFRVFRGISGDRRAVQKLNAILGYKAAKKAQAFLQIFEAVGSMERLLADPENCDLPDELAKKWVVACKLPGEANQKNTSAVMVLASRLMGPGSFLESYVAKCICKQKPSLSTHPAIARWMAEHVLSIAGRGR